MLPESLLCLLSATIAYAQTTQQLTLNNITSFNTLKLSSLSSFILPQKEQLSITISLCSRSSSTPRFFVSNTTETATVDDVDTFHKILLTSGLGSWNGRFANGGVLAVESSNSDDPNGVAFDIGISDTGPIHESLTKLPFFGDTTSNQALLFSPPFQMIENIKPTFPNFTLPAANMSQPPSPANSPNYTLILSPTSAGLANGIQTSCFLSSQNTSGAIARETLWARGEEGFRTQWLMEGLTPSTNYTAFVLQNNTKVSGPIFFTTKSASFICPLVHSLPYCPGVAYSVPLPAPPEPNVAYDSTNLPAQITTPLLSYMANFTTVLTSFACGRDWYSPLVGCEDCQHEYRKWLCAISFTRCSESSPSNPNGFTAAPAPPSATGLVASSRTNAAGAQIVLSALLPQQTSDPQRNTALPALDGSYTMLLPCLEMCNAVDRACPPFLQFRCPTADFNAAASYGVGYIDDARGGRGNGLTGDSQDRWGNVWCHKI